MALEPAAGGEASRRRQGAGEPVGPGTGVVAVTAVTVPVSTVAVPTVPLAALVAAVASVGALPEAPASAGSAPREAPQMQAIASRRGRIEPKM